MTNSLRDRWGLPALQQALQAIEPGLELEAVESIDSTNTALLQRAAAMRSAGTPGAAENPDTPPHWPTRLLVAERQTQGRGRQGRTWQAQPGSSLTFSLALLLAPQDWSGLSLAVGVALADALDGEPEPARDAAPATATGPRIGLKWPNDLWLRDDQAPAGGRKLGGVLIETSAWVGPGPVGGAVTAPAAPRICVIGVGLNIGPQAVEEASSGVAWVQELLPGAPPHKVLARVAAPLLRAVRRFEQHGFSELAAAFARRDLLQGQAVSTTLTDLPMGTAQGVDDTGALKVLTPDRTLRTVVGGEVSIRLQPKGPACA
jgi:BirA family biotin operon repressor/biotin-[acetyl-CoA-carboxylase] ligase